jgi:hypothetical protein
MQLLHEFIFLVDNKLNLRYHQHNCVSEVLQRQLLLVNLPPLQVQQALRYPVHVYVYVPLNEF